MTIRDHLLTMLSEHDLQYFLTFNFGRTIVPAKGEPKVKHLFNQLQDQTYGGRWARRRGADRITAFGFWERLDTNAHLHVEAYIPDAVVPYLHDNGADLWSKLELSGQLDIEVVRDRDRVGSYITKRVHRPDDLDHMFVYTPPGGSGLHRDDTGLGLVGRTPRQPAKRVPLHVQWRS